MPSIARIGLARGPALRRPVRPTYLPAERAGSSATVAQLGLRGDTLPRLQLGLDGSDRPQVVYGTGQAQDVRLFRNATGQLFFDAAGAAVPVSLEVQTATGQLGYIGVLVAADSNARALLEGDATGTGLLLGPGNASQDVFLHRTAASVLTLDNNASGAATLALNGQADVKAESAPSTPASGYGRLYYSSANKHFYQIDDAGLASDLVATVSTINFVIDGGGSTPGTGVKGDLFVDFACTINQVTLTSDVSGSCVVDIWKTSYASGPPTVSNTITASDLPTLSSAQKSQDSSLTGWTTAISAGDWLRFNLNSASTLTRVTVSLKVTRT